MTKHQNTLLWKMSKGHDRRLREGHPWVFSNELANSPKGVPPGGMVTLIDVRGQFLAHGYGNPNSLICARVMSRRVEDSDWNTHEFLVNKVIAAWKRRFLIGFNHSFRLVFSESDLLPGLIIDRYEIESKAATKCQVLVAQMTTAGMDTALRPFEDFFKALVERAFEMQLSSYDWNQTAIVIRNDASVREMEGLKVEPPQEIKSVEGFDLENATILVGREQPAHLQTDLVSGQKTGFFLDQTRNILEVAKIINESRGYSHKVNSEKPRFEMLDLCCYVGHWSSQMALKLGHNNYSGVKLNLVDVSETALKRAFLNAEKNLAGRTGDNSFKYFKMDVFEGELPFPAKSQDLVVADPPALIKSRKVIEQGRHGYVKINSRAAALVKSGGYLVTCSCSGLLPEEEFSEAILKGFRKAGRSGVLLYRGGHNMDHPQRPEFPEGTYLKMHLYQLD